MKEAFSMLEVVVTVMIIGIFTAIATEFIPNNSLLENSSYILYKIKETQAKALLNQDKENCITLNNKIYDTSKNHQITIESSLFNKKLCFDSEGKPFENNLSAENMIKKPVTIKIKKQKEEKDLILMPFSGLVVIK